VQFPAELDQGAIAAGSDVRNDRAHDRFDVGRRLALGGEKDAETLAEIRGAAVEADRHGPVLPAGRGSGPMGGWEKAATPGGGGGGRVGLGARPPARRAPEAATAGPATLP